MWLKWHPGYHLFSGHCLLQTVVLGFHVLAGLKLLLLLIGRLVIGNARIARSQTKYCNPGCTCAPRVNKYIPLAITLKKKDAESSMCAQIGRTLAHYVYVFWSMYAGMNAWEEQRRTMTSNFLSTRKSNLPCLTGGHFDSKWMYTINCKNMQWCIYISSLFNGCCHQFSFVSWIPKARHSICKTIHVQ